MFSSVDIVEELGRDAVEAICKNRLLGSKSGHQEANVVAEGTIEAIFNHVLSAA